MEEHFSIIFREMSAGGIITHFEESRESILVVREKFCENFPSNPLLHTQERADLIQRVDKFLNQQTPFDFLRVLFERSCHKHDVSSDMRTEMDILLCQFFNERKKMIREVSLGQKVLHGRRLERSVGLLFAEGSNLEKILLFFKAYYADPAETFRLPPYPGIGFEEESAGFPLVQPPIPWRQ